MPMPDATESQPANAAPAVTHRDPHPYYRELREGKPPYFDEDLKR